MCSSDLIELSRTNLIDSRQPMQCTQRAMIRTFVFCPQLIPFKTPARQANYYDQASKEDLKSGHPKCAMGSAEMNNL